MPATILLAGLQHESNTFSPTPTDLDAFRRYQFAEGRAILDTYAGTNTELGGMMAAAGALGLDLRPALFASAVPAGRVTRDAFETLVGTICRAAERDGPFDGALIALHGAMVAETFDRADAELVGRLRRVLGPRTPIVCTFDLHANLSADLVEAADVLIGYDTFPHVDCGERGREAAAVLAGLLRDGDRPGKALAKLPLVSGPVTQLTAESPMAEAMAAVRQAEAGPGVLCCSVAPGFPYADVAHLGTAVVAYGETGAAAQAADRVARLIWKRRQAVVPQVVPVEAAVARALRAARGPVVLAESADNVGGGSPGDGAVVLSALLRARAAPAAVVIWDPEAVARAFALGSGGAFAGPVGGKTTPLLGAPAELSGTVERLDDITYRRSGPYMTGQPVRMGRVAVVDCGGVRVLLTTERVMPFDADHLRVAGIEPVDQRILVAKSGNAWRAAFGDIAVEAIQLDTPGVCPPLLSRLPFTRLERPLYPLDEAARWPDETAAG